MLGLFTIKVTGEFAAAHALRGYEGECARLHGHNWKVEIEVQTRQLNAIGIGLDFKDLKRALKSILAHVDHYNLNDIPPFDTLNPTAENIVAWLFKKISALIDSKHAQLTACTLWENDRSSVRYTEPSYIA